MRLRCFLLPGKKHDSLLRYDLEDAFGKYGAVKNVWVARRPPGFGFVEMEARQDAEEAVGKTITDKFRLNAHLFS